MTAPGTIDIGGYRAVDLGGFAGPRLMRLPYSHRQILENLLWSADEPASLDAAHAILDAPPSGNDTEIVLRPRRILMHDTTCTPALVDLAAMRTAVAAAGGDPMKIDAALPVHVTIDHSIGVDRHASPDSFVHNIALEIERHAERYRFMKWAAEQLPNVTVLPPGIGIMHTVHLETLAQVVERTGDSPATARCDVMIGTDSHTPMIGGLGIFSLGVGGLEAEAVMLGQPLSLRLPPVIAVRLTGALRDGVLATDAVLAVTDMLRRHGVVGRIVEFIGPGVAGLSVGERAVITNMAPEYGATTALFPIDAATVTYLRQTGRDPHTAAYVETFAKAQGLWFSERETPDYEAVLELDLATLPPTLSGPERPQDSLSLCETGKRLKPLADRRGGPPRRLRLPALDAEIHDNAVLLAAITSCTNTSDPKLLLAAGLFARKARQKGLVPKPWVKTTLAPGSQVARAFLDRAGLLADFAALGFTIDAFGCTSCIGNSGPLPDAVAGPLASSDLIGVAVLSGNRNFPGRVHNAAQAAFLMSPPMVVAFALAGHADIDLTTEPLGTDSSGAPVYLADLWPSGAEIDAVFAEAHRADDYAPGYMAAMAGTDGWKALDPPDTPLYPWAASSNQLMPPPFVAALPARPLTEPLQTVPLLVLGDDITTDHITPAGQIPPDSLAGRYLTERGEQPDKLNVYAARRGHADVMVRGAFTNPRAINHLCPDAKPGQTIDMDSGDIRPLFDVARDYAARGQATAILAGARYGTGSSRDWAAKAARMLGVTAVIAKSFERIHRNNLIGIGLVPIELPEGPARDILDALDPPSLRRIEIVVRDTIPGAAVDLTLTMADGQTERIEGRLAVQTRRELDDLKAGGVIPRLLAAALETA